MSRTKRVIAGLFLGLLVTANLAQINAPVTTDSHSMIEARLFPIGILKLKKKQFNAQGTFLGCWGVGSDCLTIPIGDAQLTVSSAGVHTQ
ncbi:MAG: hypothetical protein RBT76_13630 [candidate division Zixibacteria bacterium]|nr:hypothetical protein [candidate division Zixibacteria bacterium]